MFILGFVVGFVVTSVVSSYIMHRMLTYIKDTIRAKCYQCAGDIVKLDRLDGVINKEGVVLSILKRHFCGGEIDGRNRQN